MCPANCQEKRCNINTGYCLGCLPGYKDQSCKHGNLYCIEPMYDIYIHEFSAKNEDIVFFFLSKALHRILGLYRNTVFGSQCFIKHKDIQNPEINK